MASVIGASACKTAVGFLDISFFQAEDGIRYHCVTGVQTCALPIYTTSVGSATFSPSASFQPKSYRPARGPKAGIGCRCRAAPRCGGRQVDMVVTGERR